MLKSKAQNEKFQNTAFCKTACTESKPQKERRQKAAAAVFRVACSIRRSNPTPRMLLGVLNRKKI